MEYRLCLRHLKSHDYLEGTKTKSVGFNDNITILQVKQTSCDCENLIVGVRAMLIDKDKQPKWNPSRIEDVSDEMVLSCFQSLPSDDDFPV